MSSRGIITRFLHVKKRDADVLKKKDFCISKTYYLRYINMISRQCYVVFEQKKRKHAFSSCLKQMFNLYMLNTYEFKP